MASTVRRNLSKVIPLRSMMIWSFSSLIAGGARLIRLEEE